jgi:hypothetical protein
MPLNPNVNVTLAYGVESTFGVAATAGGTSKFLRRVSSGLSLNKESFQSNEVRNDLEISDLRHGMRSAGGSIEGELSLTSYDDFLEAAMCGTWAAGATKVGTDSVTTQANSITRGTGSWITDGFKIGDVVRFTNLSDAANNSKNLTVTALTALVMTVAETLVVNAVGDTSWNAAVQGFKLTTGLTTRSFTIEQRYTAIDISEQFLGMRVGGFKISVPPNGMATISLDFMGKDASILSAASSPYFTAITAAPNTAIMAGSTGYIRLNSAQQLAVTSLDLSLTNNLSNTPVIGTNVSPDILYGRRQISGSVSVYLESEALLNVFANETEVDLFMRLELPGAAPLDFMQFTITRLKLGGISKSIGTDGGVVAQFPFTALLRTGGSGTAYDQTSLTIQRSL